MTNNSTTTHEDYILKLEQAINVLQSRIHSLESRPDLRKEIFNSEEAAAFLGITRSQLYKLTYNHEIPFYKPSGKLVLFERQELINWVRTNKA